jgi:hypothetical protein
VIPASGLLCTLLFPRSHRRGRRRGVPACLQDGPRRDRVEAADCALPVRAVAGLDQGEEPGQPGDAAGAGGDVVNKVRKRTIRLLPSIASFDSRSRDYHGGDHADVRTRKCSDTSTSIARRLNSAGN